MAIDCYREWTEQQHQALTQEGYELLNQSPVYLTEAAIIEKEWVYLVYEQLANPQIYLDLIRCGLNSQKQ